MLFSIFSVIFSFKIIFSSYSDNPLSNDVRNYLSKCLDLLGGNPDHTEVYKVIKK